MEGATSPSNVSRLVSASGPRSARSSGWTARTRVLPSSEASPCGRLLFTRTRARGAPPDRRHPRTAGLPQPHLPGRRGVRRSVWCRGAFLGVYHPERFRESGVSTAGSALRRLPAPETSRRHAAAAEGEARALAGIDSSSPGACAWPDAAGFADSAPASPRRPRPGRARAIPRRRARHVQLPV